MCKSEPITRNRFLSLNFMYFKKFRKIFFEKKKEILSKNLIIKYIFFFGLDVDNIVLHFLA